MPNWLYIRLGCMARLHVGLLHTRLHIHLLLSVRWLGLLWAAVAAAAAAVGVEAAGEAETA